MSGSDTVQVQLWQAVGSPATIIFTALRVAVVFVIVLGLLRVSGKRVLGQFTPFDLVALLLISNVVQNTMIGPDTSVVGGLLGAAVILALNRLVSNDDRLRHFLEGSPTLLVENWPLARGEPAQGEDQRGRDAVGFAAFDVSQELTAVCVVNRDGVIVAETKVVTGSEAITAYLEQRSGELERVGMETGPLAVWLWNALVTRGLPIICLDARHANGVLR